MKTFIDNVVSSFNATYLLNKASIKKINDTSLGVYLGDGVLYVHDSIIYNGYFIYIGSDLHIYIKSLLDYIYNPSSAGTLIVSNITCESVRIDPLGNGFIFRGQDGNLYKFNGYATVNNYSAIGIHCTDYFISYDGNIIGHGDGYSVDTALYLYNRTTLSDSLFISYIGLDMGNTSGYIPESNDRLYYILSGTLMMKLFSDTNTSNQGSVISLNRYNIETVNNVKFKYLNGTINYIYDTSLLSYYSIGTFQGKTIDIELPVDISEKVLLSETPNNILYNKNIYDSENSVLSDPILATSLIKSIRNISIGNDQVVVYLIYNNGIRYTYRNGSKIYVSLYASGLSSLTTLLLPKINYVIFGYSGNITGIEFYTITNGYLCDSGGTQIAQRTTGVVSHDMKYIYYAKSGTSGIYKYDLNTHTSSLLYSVVTDYLSLSNDGKYLLYRDRSRRMRRYTIATGSLATYYIPNGSYRRYTLDDKNIVYAHSGDSQHPWLVSSAFTSNINGTKLSDNYIYGIEMNPFNELGDGIYIPGTRLYKSSSRSLYFDDMDYNTYSYDERNFLQYGKLNIDFSYTNTDGYYDNTIGLYLYSNSDNSLVHTLYTGTVSAGNTYSINTDLFVLKGTRLVIKSEGYGMYVNNPYNLKLSGGTPLFNRLN